MLVRNGRLDGRSERLVTIHRRPAQLRGLSISCVPPSDQSATTPTTMRCISPSTLGCPARQWHLCRSTPLTRDRSDLPRMKSRLCGMYSANRKRDRRLAGHCPPQVRMPGGSSGRPLDFQPSSVTLLTGACKVLLSIAAGLHRLLACRRAGPERRRKPSGFGRAIVCHAKRAALVATAAGPRLDATPSARRGRVIVCDPTAQRGEHHSSLLTSAPSARLSAPLGSRRPLAVVGIPFQAPRARFEEGVASSTAAACSRTSLSHRRVTRRFPFHGRAWVR